MIPAASSSDPCYLTPVIPIPGHWLLALLGQKYKSLTIVSIIILTFIATNKSSTTNDKVFRVIVPGASSYSSPGARGPVGRCQMGSDERRLSKRNKERV